MRVKEKMIDWANSPKWKEYNTIFSVWTIAAIVYALVKLLIGKYNNYLIFKGVFWHTINNQSLYAEYPEQYYDHNHYGIIFSLIIAPFAVMPDWLGIVLWLVANTALLFFAIQQLPLSQDKKAFIYWFSFIELLTAQSMQQFNISVAAIIILAFVFIQQKKDFWAAAIIIIGFFVKLYPIVGLAFFFFSKNKVKLIVSCIFWSIVFFVVPMIYTSGFDYVISQYQEWFARLEIKNELNKFATSQNISLLGLVRKVSGNANYSDLLLIIPGLILFFVPYFRVKQYKHINFRLMLLANVLLFMVLFSTGSEGSGYITAMIGVALWYVCSPSKYKSYNKWLMIITLITVAISSTELVPSFIRKEFIVPYVFKSWACIVVWLTICYEMIFLNFSTENESTFTTTELNNSKTI